MTRFALLCPGQASQGPTMFDHALAVGAGTSLVAALEGLLGQDPLALVRSGHPSLFENRTAQPLVCAATLAAWEALRARLPRPDLVLGYSVGELSAYGCAGALEAVDVVALAAQRAAAMDEAAKVPGGLMAVRGVPSARLEALAAAAGVEIAILNGPDHAVLGGSDLALHALAGALQEAGATSVQRLSVSVPAHTSLLAAAVSPFAAALRRSALSDPAVPVLAGESGVPVRRREEAISTLSGQLAQRLEWARCLEAARELGCGILLELPPGQALSRMASELLPDVAVRAVSEFRTLDGAVAWVLNRLGR
jgi:[acyl-carrier-protein] S-malonyltransferase